MLNIYYTYSICQQFATLQISGNFYMLLHLQVVAGEELTCIDGRSATKYIAIPINVPQNTYTEHQLTQPEHFLSQDEPHIHILSKPPKQQQIQQVRKKYMEKIHIENLQLNYRNTFYFYHDRISSPHLISS